jgi:peptidoglycan/LPS O-acetylase OafA/YrhL
MKHRPEIDGLRAIAVTAVVLFHVEIMRAGYLGVDVFFVISGYLITGLLLEGIDIRTFYARRVRRIVPAVTVLIMTVAVASPFVYSGEALLRAEQSAAASSLFAANIYFQHFGNGGSNAPLIHLWTLGVEEQFYLAWPLLLLLIPRRRLTSSLIALSLGSLALAWWLMRTNPDAAFYQMPARFWEFAAGGIIASLPPMRLPKFVAPTGIGLTIFACAVPLGSLPGPATLPAVIGACIVTAAIHGGSTNTFLASRPMVGLGLVSYSLYLWHWPLVAFYGEPDPGRQLILLAIALLLSFLSYRFIETPFRRSAKPLNNQA